MGVLKRAVGERIGGSRPSMGRALAAAVVVGVAAAGITYRVLRG